MRRTAKKKPKKEFHRRWVFETFARDESFYEKRMFGGLSAYLRGRMVMVLVESPGETSYRGKDHGIPIWDGVLLPTHHEYQPSLIKEFPSLLKHPVLGKWLYLPAHVDDFEETSRELGELIASGDERLGIEPKMKQSRSRKK